MRTFLSAILISSNVVISYEAVTTDTSFCHNNLCFSRDVWMREVRTRFEITLASIQGNLVNIVRDNTERSTGFTNSIYYVELPPNYRGLCSLGKFRAVGWRNVSAWGLLGLFALALAVSLASIQNEKEEYWIAIATRKVVRGVTWLIDLLYMVPWTFMRTELRRKFRAV